MSTAESEFWRVPPLSAEDQALVDAYQEIGKPLDRLPYSEDFDRLMKMLSKPLERDQMFLVHQRLLHLRKTGRLPAIGRLAV